MHIFLLILIALSLLIFTPLGWVLLCGVFWFSATFFVLWLIAKAAEDLEKISTPEKIKQEKCDCLAQS